MCLSDTFPLVTSLSFLILGHIISRLNNKEKRKKNRHKRGYKAWKIFSLIFCPVLYGGANEGLGDDKKVGTV